MIFNNELLFIHVPKTAGISISRFLLKNLSGTVYYTVPNGHGGDAPSHVRILKGRRHENLRQAQDTLSTMHRSLTSFRIILSTVRNPYALEVSRYHYLRLGRPWDKGQAQNLALAGDFTDFAVYAPFLGHLPSRIEHFYIYNGEFPSNLVILRQENLEPDLNAALKEYIPSPITLPKLNKTRHDDYSSYITPAAEEGIYKKFQWLFDEGFYSRYNP
jgi:hypothetical protein